MREQGDPDIIAGLDSGYDMTRLAWLLDGLPVDFTGRRLGAGQYRPGSVDGPPPDSDWRPGRWNWTSGRAAEGRPNRWRSPPRGWPS